MLSDRTELDEVFEYERSPVLVPGLIALIAIGNVASAVFALMAM